MTAMKPMLVLLMPLIFMLILPVSSGAGVYKYTDSDGNVFFTDSPPVGVKTKKMKYRDQSIDVHSYGDESDSLTGDSESPGDTVKKKRPYSDVKVVLYMKSRCPYSMKAGKLIRSLGVRLLQFDINQNPSKKREMINLGYGKGVPIIDVEGIVIPGYNPEAIKDAVEQKRIY
jgi:glutaredoxin